MTPPFGGACLPVLLAAVVGVMSVVLFQVPFPVLPSEGIPEVEFMIPLCPGSSVVVPRDPLTVVTAIPARAGVIPGATLSRPLEPTDRDAATTAARWRCATSASVTACCDTYMVYMCDQISQSVLLSWVTWSSLTTKTNFSTSVLSKHRYTMKQFKHLNQPSRSFGIM